MDWSQVPLGEVKAARQGGPSTITAQRRCRQCTRLMWTCNDQLEDLCEEDEFYLRMSIWDLRAKRGKAAAQKPFNPFGDNSGITRTFWPKDSF